MLVIVTVILLVLGWYVNRAQRQRKTVLWIEANGGFVSYDHDTDSRFSNRALAPPVGYQGVASLRHSGTGVDYFHSVVRVRIGKLKVPDDASRSDGVSAPVPFALPRLAGLTHLEELDIRRNVAGNLEPLRGMVNLRKLSLQDVDTDDFGPLAGMTQLETLYMETSNVSDLRPLANLRQLRWVHLDCPNVRDVRPLAKLPRLDYLALNHSEIDDLSPLLQFPALTRLGLSGATVEDWTPLEKMKGFSGLWLDDSNIEIDELERIDAKLGNGAVRHHHMYK